MNLAVKQYGGKRLTNILIDLLCSRNRILGSRALKLLTERQIDLHRYCSVLRTRLKLPSAEVVCECVCVPVSYRQIFLKFYKRTSEGK